MCLIFQCSDNDEMEKNVSTSSNNFEAPLSSQRTTSLPCPGSSGQKTRADKQYQTFYILGKRRGMEQWEEAKQKSEDRKE